MKKFYTARAAAEFSAELVLQWKMDFDLPCEKERLFQAADEIDGDYHIEPGDPQSYYIVADDGGIGLTNDGGAHIHWFARVSVPAPVYPPLELADSPVKVVTDEVKGAISGFKEMLKIKNLGKKLLITAVTMAGSWLVAGISQKIFAENIMQTPFVVKLIAFLSFANGGVSNNLWYMLGGAVGKALLSSTLFMMITGGWKNLKGGVDEFLKTAKALGNTEVLSKFLIGAGGGLILYNFFTGEAMLSLCMAGVSGLLSMLWALGGGIHFIRKMVVSLTANKRDGLLLVDLPSAMKVLSGLAAGFALSVVLSVIPFAFTPYIVGALCVVAGVVLPLVLGKNVKRAVAAMLALVLVLSSLAPLTALAYDYPEVIRTKRGEPVTKTIPPDEDPIPKDFQNYDLVRNLTDGTNSLISGDTTKCSAELYKDGKGVAVSVTIRRELLNKTLTEVASPSGDGKYTAMREFERFMVLTAANLADELAANDAKETTFAGRQAWEIFHVSSDPTDRSPSGSIQYYVVLDEDVMLGLQLVLNVEVRVSSYDPDYSGRFDMVKKMLASDGAAGQMAREAVTMPITYEVTQTELTILNGPQTAATPTGGGNSGGGSGSHGGGNKEGTPSTPGDYEHASAGAVAAAILLGFLSELAVLAGLLNGDGEGLPPIPGVPRPSDPYIEIDEDGDLWRKDPVTGKRQLWRRQPDGTYREAGGFTVATEEELREQIEHVLRNKEGYQSAYEQQQKWIKEDHERLQQEIKDKNAQWERDQIAKAEREAQEAARDAYVDKLRDKYGAIDEKDLKKELIKEKVKAGTEGDKAMADEAWAEFGEKTAEQVKKTADVGVDVLANLTGPVGKQIKTAYNVLSEFAGGMSEAYATGGDMGNAASAALAKSIIGILQDKVGDEGSLGMKFMADTFCEAAKNGFDQLGKGASPAEVYQAFVEGGVNGMLSSSVDMVSGGLKDATMGLKEVGQLGLGGDTLKGLTKNLSEEEVEAVTTLMGDLMKNLFGG